jgi:beta-N-acetylhexosaminidase
MKNYTNDMSLAEQIGQLLVVGFYGTSIPQTLRDLIERYHVGNIILFSRNIQDTRQTLQLTRDLQTLAQASGQHHPLLIMLDQENGLVRRLGPDATIFPGNVALGAIGSEQMTYDIARATGQELRALGINMNLAPVVDVNNNSANPVIGVRSFGENPQQVARLGSAAMQGYRAAGVVSTLKHFPGHGDTNVDSHRALPIIPHTLERLERVELVPFAHCIAEGAECVMIGHLYLPQLMSREALPATVSPEIVQDLLRHRLGFDGVVISDCMEMNAVARTIGTERATVMALQAGNDLVLVSHHSSLQLGSLETIYAAVQAGELSPETIRRAAERVLRLKEKYLTWETSVPSTPLELVGSAAHRRLSDSAYELSTTLVRNDEALIPLRLSPDERILALYPQAIVATAAEDRSQAPIVLVEAIERRHANTRVLTYSPAINDAERAAIQHEAAEASIVIMATLNADERQSELIHQLLQAGCRVIGIAIRNPYDLQSFPRLRTYLATYEYTAPALEAAVRVVFGEAEARGVLPVSLEGLYQL